MSNAYNYGSVQFENVDSWTRDDPQFEVLEKSIPGVNGVLTIRMGFRGETFNITGFVSQVDPDTFFAVVRDLVDGELRTFTPGHGSSIDDVRCEGIRSLGFFSHSDGFRERYQVTFKRMSDG